MDEQTLEELDSLYIGWGFNHLLEGLDTILLRRWDACHRDSVLRASATQLQKEIDRLKKARSLEAAEPVRLSAYMAPELLEAALAAHPALVDDLQIPFCACGQVWSQCDGSRVDCHRRQSPATPPDGGTPVR